MLYKRSLVKILRHRTEIPVQWVCSAKTNVEITAVQAGLSKSIIGKNPDKPAPTNPKAVSFFPNYSLTAPTCMMTYTRNLHFHIFLATLLRIFHHLDGREQGRLGNSYRASSYLLIYWSGKPKTTKTNPRTSSQVTDEVDYARHIW